MNLADGLKQLTRMCAKYHCADCPLCGVGFCPLNKRDRSVDVNEKAASVIEKWAEENPEKQYPTWAVWLQDIDVLPYDQTFFHPGLLGQIPADIAQKLGLEPEEGT